MGEGRLLVRLGARSGLGRPGDLIEVTRTASIEALAASGALEVVAVQPPLEFTGRQGGDGAGGAGQRGDPGPVDL